MRSVLIFAVSAVLAHPPDSGLAEHSVDSTPVASDSVDRPLSHDTVAEVRDTASKGHPEPSHARRDEPSKAKPHPRPAKPGGLPRHLCGALPVDRLKWDPRQGALRLGGRLVVGPGQRLTLPEGTLVVADPDTSCRDSSGTVPPPAILVAGGVLSIRGTWRNPVMLRPIREGSDLPWEGIQVSGAREGEVDLDWLEIRRARIAVNFSAGTGEIRHAVVEDCGIGFAAVGGAVPRILHCIVHGTRVADLVSERSAPQVRSCLFLDGQGDGLRFDGTGLARVSTSCFWNHRGTDVVRGPAGLGGWRSDTLPDAFGNWRRDPVFRGSAKDIDSGEKVRQEIAVAPWWKHRKYPPQPWGKGPWVLSPFSPLLGAGERRLGKRVDIGLWDETP